MPAFWLNHFEVNFPHPSLAEPDGLLAVGGDLRPERLLLAYQNGIFPWYEGHSGFAWYSPDPRCILELSELKVQRSMKSIFNQGKFRFTLDTRFSEVMRHCADVWRPGQIGTWISDSFLKAYLRMHEYGFAHSVEVWQEDRLVGGLYGLSFGKIFCGESMFALVPNASKAALIALIRALEKRDFWMVDCQVETPHLKNMGARNIPRSEFLEVLKLNLHEKTSVGRWRFRDDGELVVEPPERLFGQ